MVDCATYMEKIQQRNGLNSEFNICNIYAGLTDCNTVLLPHSIYLKFVIVGMATIPGINQINSQNQKS